MVDVKTLIFFINNKDLINNEIYNVVTKNTISQILFRIKNFQKSKINYVNSKIMNQLSYKVDGNKLKVGLIYQ